jgi:hypothetical protein
MKKLSERSVDDFSRSRCTCDVIKQNDLRRSRSRTLTWISTGFNRALGSAAPGAARFQEFQGTSPLAEIEPRPVGRSFRDGRPTGAVLGSEWSHSQKLRLWHLAGRSLPVNCHLLASSGGSKMALGRVIQGEQAQSPRGRSSSETVPFLVTYSEKL